MQNSLDLSRWQDIPHGVGYRRGVIVSTGLRQLFRLRLVRILLGAAWAVGLVVAALAFLFSQSVASGGWLESTAATFGVRAQAIASAAGAVVLLYPDICIRGIYTCIFWLQSYAGLALSLIMLSLVIPRLIARDRASLALTIYLSRPLTSLDYLLGKLGLVFGVLFAVWTGPLLFGWLVSLALAPNRDFVIYSLTPLLRALLFNGIAAVVLASIALAVSALCRSARAASMLWIGLWLIAGFIAGGKGAPEWLQQISFGHDLSQARQIIFRLDRALIEAGQNLPLINQQFAQNLTEAGKNATATSGTGTFVALGAFVAISSFIFFRRLRPE